MTERTRTLIDVVATLLLAITFLAFLVLFMGLLAGCFNDKTQPRLTPAQADYLQMTTACPLAIALFAKSLFSK